MTDLSQNDTAGEGHDQDRPPRFSTAEDVHPPLPGEPGYEDYVDRRAAWMRWVDQQRAATPGADLVATPYYDAGLGRMVTPEDPASLAEPAVDAAAGGDGADAPESQGASAQGRERPCQRSDAANGELFAQLYGGRVRYDNRRGHWLLWGGHWWRPDETGEVRIPAKEAARLRFDRATRIEDEPAAFRELERTWLEAAASGGAETGHRHPSFPSVAVESATSRVFSGPHTGMAASEDPVPR